MATIHPPSQLPLAPETLKSWTVEDYHRLSALGLLDPDERTELLAGQITVMVAKGTPHVISLQLLAQQIDKFLDDKPFFARAQDPIQLDNFSEPEPDLVIVQGQILDYIEHHPTPEDVSLVIEVADSTLNQDCNIKDKAYARANISEYWVLDLQNRQLHIYQEPTDNGYSRQLTLNEDAQVSPQAFPELMVAVSTVLPPV